MKILRFIRRSETSHFAIICFCFLLYLSGCKTLTPARLRTPEDLARDEVVQKVSESSPHLFSTLTDTRISLRIRQELEHDTERYPSVGGVLAFDKELPGVWLRGERFGRNLFTLRSYKDSFWLELPHSHEVVVGSREAYRRMPQMVRPNEILLWFASPQWLGLTWEDTVMDIRAGEYVFEVKIDGFPVRRVHVDGFDFHINSIFIYDIMGGVDTAVHMNRYSDIDGEIFPHRLIVNRPRDGFEIALQLGRPEFGRELPERTFMPRSRPGWRHIDLDRQHNAVITIPQE